MSYVLGVDLGTTFTAAAVANGSGPTMVGLGNRALQIPSVLFLTDDDFLVGEPAERRGTVEPDRVVREFKRRLGDHIPLLVAGSPFSAESLTARLLQWVVARSTERMGEAPRDIVITHPANWGPFKMEVLSQVVSLADIGNARRLPEPVAAAAQYAARARLEVGEQLAMYDLGGGTFDVCVLKKTDDGFVMLGTPEGVEHLGGVDFDEALFRQVMGSLESRTGDLDPSDPDLRVGLGRLRRDCVDAKEALSTDVDTVLPISLPGLTTTVRLTRSEFESLIRPALAETVAAMRRGLRSASVKPEDLAGIVLVGGSSRIPLVGEMLQEEFQIAIALDTHPKHDVALGAVRLDPGNSISGATARGSRQRTDKTTPSPTGRGKAARSAVATPSPFVEPSDESAPDSPKDRASSGRTRLLVPPFKARSARATDPNAIRRRRPLVVGAAAVVAAIGVTVTIVQASDRENEGGQASPGSTTPAIPPARTVPKSSSPLPNNELLWPREVTANWDIWSTRVDGVDSHRLTFGDGADTRPVISPDRRSFIYHHSADESRPKDLTLPPNSDSPASADGLHIMAVDGTGDRLLFPDGPAADLDLGRPGWSPDGNSVASAVRRPGQPTQLVLVSLDGQTVKTIAEAPRLNDPTFTRDGRSVTYWASDPTELDGGTLMTVRVDIDKPPKEFLPGKAGQDADPAWSPDGSKLAFRRRGSDGHNVWVVRRDGTGLKQLTDTPGDDQDPTWSPDSRRIAFKSARGGEPDIYVMTAEGKNPHLLMHNPEADDAPAWTTR